jgi:hypothetical protein
MHVLDSLRRFGSSAVSFLALESDMRHWFDASAPEGTGACVAYVETRGAWIAAGDPMAPSDEVARAAERFVEAAKLQGKRACFFASEGLLGDAFDRVLLGEQPIFRKAGWTKAIRERRRLREQLRRARAKLVRVRAVDAAELRVGTSLRTDVEMLAREWLRTRHMAPMRFLVALEPFHAPEEHRYFIAEREGTPIGFLSAVPIPARRGWLVEDVVRSAHAPNGTTETLLDAMFRSLDDEERATLGLAPLTGPISRWLRIARALALPLYSFSGLRAFKERLKPDEWQPVWLVLPRGRSKVLHVTDALRAFAGGSLRAFAARSLADHPSAAPFALALPLLPWTVLLAALAAAHRAELFGFSASTVAAWTLFDAALAVLLFRCALRPRRRTLATAAVAACADASLSIAHLGVAGLGHGVLEVALRAVATAAPVLGTLALAWATWRAQPGVQAATTWRVSSK